MITINYDINQPIWIVFSYYAGAWYVTLEECKISSITVKNDMSLGIRVYRNSTKSSQMISESLINTIEAQDNHFVAALSICSEEDFAYYINPDGGLEHDDVTGKSNINADYVSARPAITLIPEVMLASGDGTKTNPYKIVME